MIDDYISSQVLLQAYSEGFFPMASSRNGRIYWHSPDFRAIFPMNSLKIPKSMKQILRRNLFQFTINHDFDLVIRKCSKRDDTWISDEIIELYNELRILGYAHSVEAWKDGKICGGLYGVVLGGAFFGESMFNDVSSASKAAFYYLVNHLKERDFLLLDSQYINDFTEQLGAIEIPRDDYLELLDEAIGLDRNFG